MDKVLLDKVLLCLTHGYSELLHICRVYLKKINKNPTLCYCECGTHGCKYLIIKIKLREEYM